MPDFYMPQQQGYEPVQEKDKAFMEWYLNVEMQIDELVNQWRGYERTPSGKWIKTAQSESRQIMNEQGIWWSYTFLSNLAGKAPRTSNYNERMQNYIMYELVYKPVFYGLEGHFHDFGFKRAIDLETVGTQICRLALDIILGARGDGYRRFISTTHQVSEVTTKGNEAKGFFSGIASLFKRQDQQQHNQMQGGY